MPVNRLQPHIFIPLQGEGEEKMIRSNVFSITAIGTKPLYQKERGKSSL